MSASEIAINIMLGHVIVLALLWFRAEKIMSVNFRILDEPESALVGLARYRALPDLKQQIFHPKYWHLWTFDQWMGWIEGRTE